MATGGYNITIIDGNPYVVYPDGTTYSTIGGTVQANCTLSVCPLDQSIYGYRPTLPGSIVLIALYGICAIVQLILGVRYKTWGYMTAMILGCLDEIIGYIARVLYYYNPWNGPSFVMQIVTITIGPVFFSAAIYVMIYKIINYIDVASARFNPRLIYWMFITFDIISLVIQSVGGAKSANNESDGAWIAVAGLAFQVATLTAFILICADYAVRSSPMWQTRSLPSSFKLFIGFLSLATLTIFIRCTYRVYELSEGFSRTSTALHDQNLFIGLESVMVIVAAFALIGAHPGLVFNRHDKEVGGPRLGGVEDVKAVDIEESSGSSQHEK